MKAPERVKMRPFEIHTNKINPNSSHISFTFLVRLSIFSNNLNMDTNREEGEIKLTSHNARRERSRSRSPRRSRYDDRRRYSRRQRSSSSSDSYRRYRKDRSRDDLRRRSQTDRRRSRRYSSESSEEEKRDKKKVVAPVEPKG
jgi:hypothetical protein